MLLSLLPNVSVDLWIEGRPLADDTDGLDAVFGEEVMAPIDGLAQRLVPRNGDPARAGEQPEAIIEPRGNLLHRQGADPCSGELDRERNPVQAPADLRDGWSVAFSDSEVRHRGDGPLDEEADCLVLRQLLRGGGLGIGNGQGRHWSHGFTRNRQPLPTRRDHTQQVAGSQEGIDRLARSCRTPSARDVRGDAR